MVETTRIEGARALQRSLKRLPRDVRRRVVNRALRLGAIEVRDTARSLAPRDTGFLVTKINLKVDSPSRLRSTSLAGRVRIGVERGRERPVRVLGRLRRTKRTQRGLDFDQRDPYYWIFLEFGTSRMPARPFLTPAFEMRKFSVNETILRETRVGIERAARRLRRRRGR